MNKLEHAEGPTVAIWGGLALAFGILVHRIFFLFALMIALATPFGWLIHRLREEGGHSGARQRQA